jgi:putative protein kinase ArgK-like GTPase of G3E family
MYLWRCGTLTTHPGPILLAGPAKPVTKPPAAAQHAAAASKAAPKTAPKTAPQAAPQAADKRPPPQCVIILRGLPGSGKSTRAEQLAAAARAAGYTAAIHSTDSFCTDPETGKYR